jgi:uroporphyrinogen decarboxylase
MMTSRQRMLAALTGERLPDHLPVTTHHVMTYFLDHYMQGATVPQFFDTFELDAYTWVMRFKDTPKVQINPEGYSTSPDWQITCEQIFGRPYQTRRYTIHTPGGELTMELQSNEHTVWQTEHPIKETSDIELLNYLPVPVCDADAVNASSIGERGLLRGHIIGFDLYGQPGTWQDASCLVGIERLIFAAHDDPAWVHELLGILQRRKLAYIETLPGARYDVLELGGGDASTTVISPRLFRKFVAPYDSLLIQKAHAAGQRIVYHTCGGMMPILEDIADMGPDAMETFTPADMGGDVNLAAARRRLGDRVCFIGGFDQFHFFLGCTPEATRAEVRRCFDAAGQSGRLILSPSDHFFDVDLDLLHAFSAEARSCTYA